MTPSAADFAILLMSSFFTLALEAEPANLRPLAPFKPFPAPLPPAFAAALPSPFPAAFPADFHGALPTPLEATPFVNFPASGIFEPDFAALSKPPAIFPSDLLPLAVFPRPFTSPLSFPASFVPPGTFPAIFVIFPIFSSPFDGGRSASFLSAFPISAVTSLATSSSSLINPETPSSTPPVPSNKIREIQFFERTSC